MINDTRIGSTMLGLNKYNDSNITISTKEYKQLIIDAEVVKERERLAAATASCKARENDCYKEQLAYSKRYSELQNIEHSNSLDKIKEDKLERYERNWFVKLFLMKK